MAGQSSQPIEKLAHILSIISPLLMANELLSTFDYVYQALDIQSDEENRFRTKLSTVSALFRLTCSYSLVLFDSELVNGSTPYSIGGIVARALSIQSMENHIVNFCLMAIKNNA